MDRLVVETRPISGAGNIRAAVTVSIPTPFGPITIYQAKLIQKTGGDAWVALPRGSYVKDGQTHWVNHIELPWQLKKQLLDEVLVSAGMSQGTAR